VYRSFGFEPIETPALENLEILQGSGGQENEKLIFKTLKRGEKLTDELGKSPADVGALADLGLRFDLTVPLCRVVAQYQNEIKLPWKVFHIAPVWRAERPQKGRYREFFQCDVDIVGSDSIAAELEVIQAVVEAFNQVQVSDLVLHLNHRSLIEKIGDKFGFGQKISEFAILLDKKDKLPFEKLKSELETLLGSRLSSEFESILQGELPFEDLKSFCSSSYQSLSYMMEELEKLNLSLARIVFDPSLVRGMGYYTGSVFELRHPSAGCALGGGGRYDGLIGRFSKSPIPAVGFSIGLERLLLLLQEKQSFSDELSVLFIPVMNEALRGDLFSIAKELRANQIAVDVFPGEAKLKNQLKFATSRAYRWVLLVGEEELQSGEFQLKDFSDGSVTKINRQKLLTHLKRLLLPAK